ncbi:hypothetical protein P7H60_01520 [Vagococcus carniphilus]|uniref:hypothetical protein n=1 Tax=Vagococcus carniphilus TaxID=218144 RepID=UPI00288F62D5|nr:hypothetical protein [Vagococcus carniphilus]MDT2847847.1 hypothetical protein [Vagococcus carniphilus]
MIYALRDGLIFLLDEGIRIVINAINLMIKQSLLVSRLFENIGNSSRKENVLHVLGALEAVLIFHGVNVSPGKAVQEALNVYLTSK